MTVSAPKVRTRLRPLARSQLRRLEEEISRFIRRRRVSPFQLEALRRWADSLAIRLRVRWISLRVATSGPRQRLATTACSLWLCLCFVFCFGFFRALLWLVLV